MRSYFFYIILSLVFFVFQVLPVSSAGQNPVSASKIKNLFEKSVQFFKQNQYAKAIELLNEASAIDNSNYVIYYNLGTIYFKLKKYDEAINNLISSVKYNPDHQESFYNLGLCYLFKNEYVKAADYFKRSIELNQYDIEAHINLGLAYKNLKQYESAEIEYQKALQIDGDNIAALINLAAIFKIRNDTDKAINFYNRVLKIEPGNTEALYNLTIINNINEKQKAVSEDTQFIKYKSPITGKEVSLPISIKFAATIAEDTAIVNADTSSADSENKKLAADSTKFTRAIEDLKADITQNQPKNQAQNKDTDDKYMQNQNLSRELIGELKNLVGELRTYSQTQTKLFDRIGKMEGDISEIKKLIVPSPQTMAFLPNNVTSGILQNMITADDFYTAGENLLSDISDVDFNFESLNTDINLIESVSPVIENTGFLLDNNNSSELIDISSFDINVEPANSSASKDFFIDTTIKNNRGQESFPELFNSGNLDDLNF